MSTKLRKKSLIVRLRRSSAMVDVSLHGNTTHPGIDSAAVRHWRRYLGGIEPCYVPSLGQAQGQGDKEPVRSIELQLGSDERLTEISKEHRVLAASILQTAWALVLKRHLGRESTCFGCQSLSYEDIVERPTSTHSFALRNDWPRHKTAIEAAQHVGNQFARSMLHQGCSLVQINTHAPSGGPMFNTAMFIYNHEHTKIDLPNCQSLQCGHDVRMMEDDQVRNATGLSQIMLTLVTDRSLDRFCRLQRTDGRKSSVQAHKNIGRAGFGDFSGLRSDHIGDTTESTYAGQGRRASGPRKSGTNSGPKIGEIK